MNLSYAFNITPIILAKGNIYCSKRFSLKMWIEDAVLQNPGSTFSFTELWDVINKKLVINGPRFLVIYFAYS